jgi:hypothetical protein
MCRTAILLAFLSAHSYGGPIISGGAGVNGPPPVFSSASCAIPCSVSTNAGSASASAERHFDPVGLTLGLSTYVTASSSTRFFTYASASASITDSLVLSVDGQGAGTVAVDVSGSTWGSSLAEYRRSSPPSMSVRLAGNNFGFDLFAPQPCPGYPCVAAASRTLTAPVTLGEPTTIALALSIIIWSNGDSFSESSGIGITAVRFYDEQGHVLQPVEFDNTVPEAGTLVLVLSGFAVVLVGKNVTSSRKLHHD